MFDDFLTIIVYFCVDCMGLDIDRGRREDGHCELKHLNVFTLVMKWALRWTSRMTIVITGQKL